MRIGGGEVDVGVPIRVDGADIPPVGRFAVACADRALFEPVGERAPFAHGARDDVLTEIVARLRVYGITREFAQQVVRVEDVDAHAGERAVGLAGDGRWILRLLDEVGDEAVRIDRHHAECGGVLARHVDAGDGDFATVLDMIGEREGVVHLVDVVTGQDDDVLAAETLDDVVVLVHGIGGALVPVGLIETLLGGHHIDELVELALEVAPTALDVAHEAVALVLGQYADAADAGVQAVGERKIDDAELAAEIDGRLGATVGEVHQPTAPTTRQDERHRTVRQIQAGGDPIGDHGAAPGGRNDRSQV